MIKHRDKLLAELVFLIKREPKLQENPSNWDIVFVEGPTARPVLQCGVFTAFEYLVGDIYYNEEGDWSDADNLGITPH